MAEIIARFADGRLLVQEDRLVEQTYMGSGIPVRIGHLRQVEKVLSIAVEPSIVSGSPLIQEGGFIARLSEVTIGSRVSGATISGSKAQSPDNIRVVLRRGDTGQGFDPALISGSARGVSGSAPVTSGYGPIYSGLGWQQEILSGAPISGRVRVIANVIGY